MSQTLAHNPKNAVTASIELIQRGDQPAVRKTLNGKNTPAIASEWRASDNPEHWNYWQREAHVYQSPLTERLEGSGVRLPKLLAADAPDEHTIALTLEAIPGRSGFDLTQSDYLLAARQWGRAQAQLLQHRWQEPWLSRDFITQYTRSKPADYGLLYDDEAWQQPLIAENWPAHLRADLQFLYEQRSALLDIVSASPRTPCHLDFWPNNIFISDAELVPIDWAFYGVGAWGEDIANFIPDAVFDGFARSADLDAIAQPMLDAYLEGVNAHTELLTPRDLNNTVQACAVKYVWLGPLLLARAGAATQHAYGGQTLTDANTQYRERGATLAYLCDWARQVVARA